MSSLWGDWWRLRKQERRQPPKSGFLMTQKMTPEKVADQTQVVIYWLMGQGSVNSRLSRSQMKVLEVARRILIRIADDDL